MPIDENPSNPPADRLDVLAAELDRLAAEVVGGLDRVAVLHRDDVWRGDRADRFGAELTRARLRLHAVADVLADAARDARARASWIRLAPSAPLSG